MVVSSISFGIEPYPYCIPLLFSPPTENRKGQTLFKSTFTYKHTPKQANRKIFSLEYLLTIPIDGDCLCVGFLVCLGKYFIVL
jgi:hypothetical protein